MTSTRSLSDRISSSSSETSRTPRPASRCSSSRLWTNSIAPTSRPRVGWAAIVTCGSSASSRAITTFCWLPPDSDPAVVSGAERAAHAGAGDVAAADAHVAGDRGAQAGDRLDQLGLAVAVDAGDADDLARADLQRQAAQRGQPAVVDH